MKNRSTCTIYSFILLSIVAHALVFVLLDYLRPFGLNRPVMTVSVEFVEVIGGQSKAGSAGSVRPGFGNTGVPREKVEEKNAESHIQEAEGRQDYGKRAVIAYSEKPIREPGEIAETNENNGEALGVEETKDEKTDRSDIASPAGLEGQPPNPVRKADEFIKTKREKLTYRIKMYGIIVGSAVLEAVNDGNEFRISCTVSSNEAISSIYPVSDFAETRLIGGRYIINRVRQREGKFTSDTGFTISLTEKNIFWIDRLHNSSSNNPLPRGDVLDVLSGLYYLRNQQLEVGKPVVLHLFDSNRYAETTVEVLRKEHVSLPGFREADAIVVHPLIETDCIFRRADDMLVWLSDDGNRVPVRFETAVPLGRVRADLVSAEEERK